MERKRYYNKYKDIAKKERYSVFDKYLQDTLWCYAFTLANAEWLLRTQALKINGKYKFDKSEIKKG